MAQMSAVFAELERALIAQRTSDALAELRSRGQVYGSVPYGFRRDGERLVKHDDEQSVLARMRRLQGQGQELQQDRRCAQQRRRTGEARGSLACHERPLGSLDGTQGGTGQS